MMRIAITGSRGLIGTAVASYFKAKGHAITHVIHGDQKRSGAQSAQERFIAWDIPTHTIDKSGLEGHDVVIHLAGANIANQRWTTGYKKLIYASRVEGTTFLSETITSLNKPPRLLISASAVGLYGNIEPPGYVNELSNMGNGFIADICYNWERSLTNINKSSIRLINMRLGVVLSKKGGMLAKILPVFKLGLGGQIGTGKQMMSWIALEEIPSAIEHLIHTENMAGPINFVAPKAVTNAEFTAILAECLKRPAVFPVPAFAIRIFFGEMGEALLLSGADVRPERLITAGYSFRYPDLKTALQGMIHP